MRREGDAQCSVKLKRGGLDVEAEEGTEEVQKGSQRVADWTLKRGEGVMKSKKAGEEKYNGNSVFYKALVRLSGMSRTRYVVQQIHHSQI